MDKIFKQEAIKMGYHIYYDQSLALWTIFKEDHDAEYIPPEIFKTTNIDTLIKIYLR